VEWLRQERSTGASFFGAFVEGARVKHTIARLIAEECGQDLVEYAFLAIFLALAVVVGLTALTTGLNTGFSNLGTQLGSGS
jgi:Flp pilus assembly pilin Flp